MELNVLSASESIVPVRDISEKKPVKGSWKKRRREQIVQKVREGKRSRSSKPKQKSKVFQIRSEEFQSGIDANSNNTEPEAEQAEHELAAKSAPANNSGPPPSSSRQEKVSFSVKEKNTLRKPRVPSRPQEVVDKPEQTPEAVNATLDILGKNAAPAGRRSPSMDDNESEGSLENPSTAKDISKPSETFAASSFEDTGLYRSIALHLSLRLGLAKPTKIQEEVLKVMLNIPEGQESIDILVRSATGSGKTLAYLLPIAHYLLNRIRKVEREDGSLALIVVPTRELADQVEEVASRIFRPWHWIVVGSVRGGESKRREKARLRKGITVLVSTPGRLLDHMRNTRSFVYDFCEFLVLDEADRLLDLGFEGEIKEMIQNLDKRLEHQGENATKRRSNILLSATLRNDVEKLAQFSLNDPIEISVGQRDEKSSTSFAMPSELRQHFCIVEQRHRLVTLASFLRLRAVKDLQRRAVEKEGEEPMCKIIVFFSTCDSVDYHYELFNTAKLPSELHTSSDVKGASVSLLPLQIFRIHGSHAQSDRLSSLRGFRNSNRAVLLCTDVAARGLDLKGLTFAIQYDPPTGGQGEELEYLHRAGRTARIGAQGDALLFLLPSERAYIGKLETKGVSISEISGSAALAALYPKVDLTQHSSISYATRLVTSAFQESFENIIKGNETIERLAFCGFQAYCRAYATHAREVRYFFHVRNLHLGHVARAFGLSHKPAEFSQLAAEIKAAKMKAEAEDKNKRATKDSKNTGDIARAIAEGEKQPYNDQSTQLVKRRRERGVGQESFREIALEFGS